MCSNKSSPQTAQLVAIYGRRRVGKTFLVRQVFSGRGLFFEVVGRRDGTMRDQLRIFAEAVGAAFFGGILPAIPASWHDAFRLLATAIERLHTSRSSKTILFFDELPWLATRRSGCLEELEHFWNSWCSKRRDVIVVLCGSSASWMIRKIVRARGGLHNRITRALRLLPFNLHETAAYLASRKVRLSAKHLIELYMILGGVPYYLNLVERGLSVPQIIDRLFFSADAPLVGEFENLYRSLFDNAETHLAVIKALAMRRSGLSRNELLAKIDVKSGGGIAEILENLEEGGFISSTVPYGKQAHGRIFRLLDELSLFHLRWVAPRTRRQRPSTQIGSWAAQSSTPAYRTWSGLAFEDLCLRHIDQLKHALGISGVATTESAWRALSSTELDGGQIDLLIDRADGIISLCEMKFSEGEFIVDKTYAAELRRKVEAFREQSRTKKALQIVLVTTFGVRPAAHAAELIDRIVTTDALLAS